MLGLKLIPVSKRGHMLTDYQLDHYEETSEWASDSV